MRNRLQDFFDLVKVGALMTLTLAVILSPAIACFILVYISAR